jgi:hypothetical protein
MSDNPKLNDEPQADQTEGTSAQQTGNRSANDQGVDNTVKDPSDWVTGDEPATGAQLSYLHTLAEGAGEEVPEGLNKAQASELIETLKAKTNQGGAQ